MMDCKLVEQLAETCTAAGLSHMMRPLQQAVQEAVRALPPDPPRETYARAVSQALCTQTGRMNENQRLVLRFCRLLESILRTSFPQQHHAALRTAMGQLFRAAGAYDESLKREGYPCSPCPNSLTIILDKVWQDQRARTQDSTSASAQLPASSSARDSCSSKLTSITKPSFLAMRPRSMWELLRDAAETLDWVIMDTDALFSSTNPNDPNNLIQQPVDRDQDVAAYVRNLRVQQWRHGTAKGLYIGGFMYFLKGALSKLAPEPKSVLHLPPPLPEEIQKEMEAAMSSVAQRLSKSPPQSATTSARSTPAHSGAAASPPSLVKEAEDPWCVWEDQWAGPVRLEEVKKSKYEAWRATKPEDAGNGSCYPQSPYKGVYWNEGRGGWKVEIPDPYRDGVNSSVKEAQVVDGQQVVVSLWQDDVEAARAWDRRALELGLLRTHWSHDNYMQRWLCRVNNPKTRAYIELNFEHEHVAELARFQAWRDGCGSVPHPDDPLRRTLRVEDIDLEAIQRAARWKQERAQRVAEAKQELERVLALRAAVKASGEEKASSEATPDDESKPVGAAATTTAAATTAAAPAPSTAAAPPVSMLAAALLPPPSSPQQPASNAPPLHPPPAAIPPVAATTPRVPTAPPETAKPIALVAVQPPPATGPSAPGAVSTTAPASALAASGPSGTTAQAGTPAAALTAAIAAAGSQTGMPGAALAAAIAAAGGSSAAAQMAVAAAVAAGITVHQPRDSAGSDVSETVRVALNTLPAKRQKLEVTPPEQPAAGASGQAPTPTAVQVAATAQTAAATVQPPAAVTEPSASLQVCPALDLSVPAPSAPGIAPVAATVTAPATAAAPAAVMAPASTTAPPAATAVASAAPEQKQPVTTQAGAPATSTGAPAQAGPGSSGSPGNKSESPEPIEEPQPSGGPPARKLKLVCKKPADTVASGAVSRAQRGPTYTQAATRTQLHPVLAKLAADKSRPPASPSLLADTLAKAGGSQGGTLAPGKYVLRGTPTLPAAPPVPTPPALTRPMVNVPPPPAPRMVDVPSPPHLPDIILLATLPSPAQAVVLAPPPPPLLSSAATPLQPAAAQAAPQAAALPAPRSKPGYESILMRYKRDRAARPQSQPNGSDSGGHAHSQGVDQPIQQAAGQGGASDAAPSAVAQAQGASAAQQGVTQRALATATSDAANTPSTQQLPKASAQAPAEPVMGAATATTGTPAAPTPLANAHSGPTNSATPPLTTVHSGSTNGPIPSLATVHSGLQAQGSGEIQRTGSTGGNRIKVKVVRQNSLSAPGQEAPKSGTASTAGPQQGAAAAGGAGPSSAGANTLAAAAPTTAGGSASAGAGRPEGVTKPAAPGSATGDAKQSAPSQPSTQRPPAGAVAGGQAGGTPAVPTFKRMSPTVATPPGSSSAASPRSLSPGAAGAGSPTARAPSAAAAATSTAAAGGAGGAPAAAGPAAAIGTASAAGSPVADSKASGTSTAAAAAAGATGAAVPRATPGATPQPIGAGSLPFKKPTFSDLFRKVAPLENSALIRKESKKPPGTTDNTPEGTPGGAGGSSSATPALRPVPSGLQPSVASTAAALAAKLRPSSLLVRRPGVLGPASRSSEQIVGGPSSLAGTQPAAAQATASGTGPTAQRAGTEPGSAGATQTAAGKASHSAQSADHGNAPSGPADRRSDSPGAAQQMQVHKEDGPERLRNVLSFTPTDADADVPAAGHGPPQLRRQTRSSTDQAGASGQQEEREPAAKKTRTVCEKRKGGGDAGGEPASEDQADKGDRVADTGKGSKGKGKGGDGKKGSGKTGEKDAAEAGPPAAKQAATVAVDDKAEKRKGKGKGKEAEDAEAGKPSSNGDSAVRQASVSSKSAAKDAAARAGPSKSATHSVAKPAASGASGSKASTQQADAEAAGEADDDDDMPLAARGKQRKKGRKRVRSPSPAAAAPAKAQTDSKAAASAAGAQTDALEGTGLAEKDGPAGSGTPRRKTGTSSRPPDLQPAPAAATSPSPAAAKATTVQPEPTAVATEYAQPHQPSNPAASAPLPAAGSVAAEVVTASRAAEQSASQPPELHGSQTVVEVSAHSGPQTSAGPPHSALLGVLARHSVFPSAVEFTFDEPGLLENLAAAAPLPAAGRWPWEMRPPSPGTAEFRQVRDALFYIVRKFVDELALQLSEDGEFDWSSEDAAQRQQRLALVRCVKHMQGRLEELERQQNVDLAAQQLVQWGVAKLGVCRMSLARLHGLPVSGHLMDLLVGLKLHL